MNKVLILSALLVVLSVPALAWQVNWSDNFESETLGDLAGQDSWITPDGAYLDTSMLVVDTTTGQNHTPGGSKSAVQIVSTTLYSSNTRDMRPVIEGQARPFYSGWARFWVWEPGTGKGEDCRVGVYGSGNNDYGGHGENSAWAMFTAEIWNGTPSWWRAQWTGDPRAIDGTVSASAAGYSWTPYAAAPRRATPGWSYAIITWGFDLTLGTGYAEWRINQTTPNIRLDFDSTAVPANSGGRWKNTTPVYGLSIGSQVVKLQNTLGMAWVDDVEFHGNITPEPTSLPALGAGLIGLAGLIRRKR